VTSPRLQDLAAYGVAGGKAGVFDTFVDRRHHVVTGGWAGKPSGIGPADAVILARQAPGGGWVPIAFAPVLRSRPDLEEDRGGAYRSSGWRRRLMKHEMEPLPARVGAWAFDSGRAWALPLERDYWVNPVPPL
jgi:hypothetical protein